VDPNNTVSGPDIYMRADYSISCESERYEFGYYWALAMIFVYPIGCPVLFAYFIFAYHRHTTNSNQDQQKQEIGTNDQIAKTDKAPNQPLVYLEAIQFLCSSYKPQFWWWEILETTQRLLLTGILVLIAQGSALQIVIGALMTICFLYLYARYEPFQDEFVLAIKIISYWQLFFVFWIALLIKADFGSIDSHLLGIFLLFAMFVNLLYDGLKFLSWIALSHWDKISQGEMTVHGIDVILSPMTIDFDPSDDCEMKVIMKVEEEEEEGGSGKCH
jgi:hypothetical protein